MPGATTRFPSPTPSATRDRMGIRNRKPTHESSRRALVPRTESAAPGLPDAAPRLEDRCTNLESERVGRSGNPAGAAPKETYRESREEGPRRHRKARRTHTARDRISPTVDSDGMGRICPRRPFSGPYR